MVGFPMAENRRLVSIRRLVPEDRIPEYAELWLALHTAATARGAHAWAFAAVDHENVFLEFLEFGDASDVRSDPDTLTAIQALHESFGDPYPAPKTLEEWVALPAPPRVEP
jgi:hypothetical protein